VAAGRVVRLGPDLHFAADAVDGARGRIVEYLEARGNMLASDARDILGTSRKYVVPLLEYFDTRGVTKREGDARTLRRD
jgi:selenocysteine-specific elongation factor